MHHFLKSLTLPLSLLLIIISETQAKPHLEITSPEAEGVNAEENGVVDQLNVEPELVLLDPEDVWGLSGATVGNSGSSSSASATGTSTNTAILSTASELVAQAGVIALGVDDDDTSLVIAGGGFSNAYVDVTGTGDNADASSDGNVVMGSMGTTTTLDDPEDMETVIAEMLGDLAEEPPNVE